MLEAGCTEPQLVLVARLIRTAISSRAASSDSIHPVDSVPLTLTSPFGLEQRFEIELEIYGPNPGQESDVHG